MTAKLRVRSRPIIDPGHHPGWNRGFSPLRGPNCGRSMP